MIDGDDEDRMLSPIDQEAHAWIRRLTSGEADAQDAAAMQRWRGQSARHAAAFSEASQFWEAFGPAGQSLRDDAKALHGRRSHQAAFIGRRSLIGGSIAAAAVGIAIVRPPLGLWPSLEELRADCRTGVGEQRQIAVAGGVSVQLNTRTSIAVGPDGNSGTIALIAGEASFKTPEGQVQPFSVLAAEGRTSATDARFAVRLVDALAACVTCQAGEVQVDHLGRTVTLRSGRQVTYGRDGIGNEVVIDLAVASAWQDGLLIFHMTPLSDVIEELNRYRSGRIVLLNAALARSPVNGRFRIKQIDEAITQIEHAFGVRRRTLPGGLVLLS